MSFVYARGKYFYTKVRGNDKFLQKGFVVTKEETRIYFTIIVLPCFHAVNDGETYEGYHLLNLLIAAKYLLFIL